MSVVFQVLLSVAGAAIILLLGCVGFFLRRLVERFDTLSKVVNALTVEMRLVKKALRQATALAGPVRDLEETSRRHQDVLDKHERVLEKHERVLETKAG